MNSTPTRRKIGLRGRLIAVLVLALSSLIALEYVNSNILLMEGYHTIERDTVRKDMLRLLAALQERQRHIQRLSADYARWDDIYQFMQHRQPQFLQSNFGGNSLANLGLDLVAILDAEQQVVYALAPGDSEGSDPIPIAEFLARLRDPDLKLAAGLAGMVHIGDQQLVVGASPILTTLERGPARGTLIFARRFDQEYVNSVSQFTDAKPSVMTMQHDGDAPHRRRLQRLQHDPVLVEAVDDDTLRAFGALNDIAGRPSLLMRVDYPREIVSQGRRSAQHFFIATLAIGIAICVISVLALNTFYLSRIRRITQAMRLVAARADLSQRIPVQGNDELSELEESINLALAELESQYAARSTRQATDRHSDKS